MYVADGGGTRILRFDPSGTPLADVQTSPYALEPTIDVDAEGNLVAEDVDAGIAYIRKFDMTGALLSSWNATSNLGASSIEHMAAAVDTSLYVSFLDSGLEWRIARLVPQGGNYTVGAAWGG